MGRHKATCVGRMAAWAAAQPLAITMAGGAALIATSIRRASIGACADKYLDEVVPVQGDGHAARLAAIDAAIDQAVKHARGDRPVGGRLLQRDRTARASAGAACTSTCSPTRPATHDPLVGYCPIEYTYAQSLKARSRTPTRTSPGAWRAWRGTSAMLELQNRGAVTFDYGNNIRQRAQGRGRRERLRLSRLRPRVHPPAVLSGTRAVPWAAVSGEARDIFVTDHGS